jgi:arsenate reductase
MPKFYHYPKCSTCRKAQKWLDKHGQKLEVVDITLSPPSIGELKKASTLSGRKITDLLNTSGVQYRQLNLKTKIKNMTEDEILQLLSKNGKLIKRPLVLDTKKATVGFKEDEFQKTWK